MLPINLADYQHAALGGGQEFNPTLFGNGVTQQDVNELNKAITAQEITGRETTNSTNASGAPLKMESLDKTLKVLTYGENDFTIYSKIPHDKAYNTVEEYNQLSSYGQQRGGFYAEGETPLSEDSTYVRRAQLVKFMGIVKGVTHPMMLVNTTEGTGAIMEREIQNGTLWLLRKLDGALTTGNEAIIPEEFNGLYTQHAANDAFTTLDAYFGSEVVIDCRGLVLKEGHVEDAQLGIVQNFGRGNELFGPPTVISNFVKSFYGNKFIPVGQPNAISNATMGQEITQVQTQFGKIGLNFDLFMNKKPAIPYNQGATSTNSPAAPVADGVTPVGPVGTDSSASWASTDAGNFFFAITAVNKFGESAATILNPSAVATIVAGGSVDLKFTAGAGPFATTGYNIYRSAKNATVSTGNYYFCFAISAAQLAAGYDGASAGLVRDRNRFMPNTDQAFLMQNNSEILTFKQLAPLMKIDLAITGPVFNFMVLMYGTPMLFAPKKFVRFINIGTNLS